jgi:hypothetical protein
LRARLCVRIESARGWGQYGGHGLLLCRGVEFHSN